jgi:hypothetical protein
VKQRSLRRSRLKVPFVTEALLIFARIVGTSMPPVNFGATLRHLDGCSTSEEVKQNGNYSYDQQDVNESAGDVKSSEAQQPQY